MRSAAQSTVESSVVPFVQPVDANTVVSTAISSIETKDSIITSIPSEAPIRDDVMSRDSSSILPLIEETFENSITGNCGGNAAKAQPFRKHARCSAQTHFDAACSECESIENNLRKEFKTKAIEEKSHLPAVLPPPSNDNVWQLSHANKYDTAEKFLLNPITVCSSQERGALASTNTNPLKFGVDSTSFIILQDPNASQFLPNITNVDSNQNTHRGNGGYHTPKVQNQFDRPCDDCCFCNPALHHKHRRNGECSPKRCNFCSSRQQSTQTTPATASMRQQDNTQTINKNAESRASAPIERIYESKYRSNHTHIRTHSKESDTVNTQCTKKTNKKVRKTLLNGNDDRMNANHINSDQINDSKADKLNGNEVNGNASKTKQTNSSIPKLPSATTNQQEWMGNSADSITSSTSSNSTGSSTKSRRKYDSKSVPNLPKSERCPAAETSPNVKSQKIRQNSRYQNFYGNGTTGSANDERTTVTSSESTTKPKPTGKLMNSTTIFMCVCVRVIASFTALFIVFFGFSVHLYRHVI